ncbi:MAG: hypothetical protein ACUVXF_00920 [Desulfobaccales bacterium]
MLWRSKIPGVMALCLIILGGWTIQAEAHRRGALPLVRPAPPPVPQLTGGNRANGPLLLQPEAYWQRLTDQEETGELQEAWKTGLALVNLFPRAPQRGLALLKLADLLKKNGETAVALELYSLAAALTAGSPEAGRASLAAKALAFTHSLPQSDPMQALGRFIKDTSSLTGDPPAEELLEALKAGWEMIFAKVQASSPVPISVLEELLALWELQPQGLRPPAAARLLADLLREKGLEQAAESLAARAEKNKKFEPLGALAPGLAAIHPLGSGVWKWATFRMPVNGGFVFDSFPAAIRVPAEPSPPVSGGLLDWFLPQTARAAWLGEKMRARETLWLQTQPNPLVRRLQAQLAHCSLAVPNPGGAREWETPRADRPGPAELEPFYQDRLGVSRLRDGQMEAAAATFHELSQHQDPFWQRLARVRLTDLELTRLQAKPSP